MSLDIGDLGGEFNAFTATDAVVFYAKVLDTKVSGALELLSDLILNPAFSPEEIERERGVIEQEITEYRNNPASRAFDLYMRTQWPTSPLGLPIGGTVESIRSFTHDTISSYATKNFTGQNMVVVAAGNLQHDDFVREVEKHFGAVSPGPAYVCTPAAAAANGVGMMVMPIDQVHLVIGVPAPPQADPRYYAVHMVSALLGQGSCSRFFHTIREQNGLVYTINSEYSPSESDGYFYVSAVTSRAHVANVQHLILREFDRLKTECPGEGEVQRFKEQFLYNYFIGTETSSDRAHMLAGQFLALGRPLSQEERQAEIEGITAEQLREVANELFDVDRMVTVAVGDVQLEGATSPQRPTQSSPQQD
jgi:predicted Zn-dependent peptidase